MQNLKGMPDLRGDDAKKYELFMETASAIVKNYGFEYIETPILEETDLYQRTAGETSDIVGKEMYSFIDKSGDDISLRPEGTAGIVRSFVQNKLDRIEGLKYKVFYSGPMFRYEQPQKGRFRQFRQFGAESFGNSKVYEDFLIITMLQDIFDALKVDVVLKINSLGCDTCNVDYRDSLRSFLETKEELCEDCVRRRGSNPLRALDCKVDKCKQVIKGAPLLEDNICASCSIDFGKLKSLLTAANIKFEVDSTLVRGLDYYNQTAFEFLKDGLALAGGGRYDKLVSELGGKSIPAVGFGIGIERVLTFLEIEKEPRSGYFFGTSMPEAIDTLFKLAASRKGEDIFIEDKNRAIIKLFKIASNKTNAKYAIIIGKEEYEMDLVTAKDLDSGEEFMFSVKEFIERKINKTLNGSSKERFEKI